MKLPWLASAPTIEVRDPLAETLGALGPEETLRYGFEDAIKLSGHSCPTVASAYVMVLVGLRELFRGETPVRGEVEVTVGGTPRDAGPIAQVATLLTGAAGETGFGGLAGRFVRRDRLRFDPELPGMRLRRGDREVHVVFDGDALPVARELGPLMGKVLGGSATAAERRRFGELWQDRVAAILLAPERFVRVLEGG